MARCLVDVKLAHRGDFEFGCDDVNLWVQRGCNNVDLVSGGQCSQGCGWVYSCILIVKFETACTVLLAAGVCCYWQLAVWYEVL